MDEERRQDYPNILSGLEEIKFDLKDIKKTINGNGKLGLFAKVEVLWGVSIFLIVMVIGIIVDRLTKG